MENEQKKLIHYNEEGKIHREDGPAVDFPEGKNY